MIRSRAPLRVPFGGGGTDVPGYRDRFGGYLCVAAINHQVRVFGARPLFDPRLRVKVHDRVELVERITDLKSGEVRSALALIGIENHVELSFMGPFTEGTGLGASGAYMVSLVNLLNRFNGKELTPVELAEAAAHIEIDILGYDVGKQDHYIATHGGFIILNIAKDNSVQVERVSIPPDILVNLESHMIIFYTHQKRERASGKILGEQKESIRRGDFKTIECYHQIKENAHLRVKALRAGDVIRCGELFDQHWRVKRQLPGGVSSEFFDFLYEEARKNGAIGGNLMGAGGGGFFVFFCEPGERSRLKEAMYRRGLEELPFHFDSRGAELDCSEADPHELAPFSGAPRRLVSLNSDLVS